jgi:uncharacterized small protein (DUF1192 family)
VLLENITQKKKLDELKKLLKDLDDINGRQKEDMKSRITTFESEIERVVADNKKYADAYRNAEASLFQERAGWVEKERKLLEELKAVQTNKGSSELLGKYLEDMTSLTRQNEELRELVQGGGPANDKVLLSRIAGYEQKIRLLEGNELLSQDERFRRLYE